MKFLRIGELVLRSVEKKDQFSFEVVRELKIRQF